MNEVVNLREKSTCILGSLKDQLLQEIRRTDYSENEFSREKIPYRYLWSTIEQMSKPSFPFFESGPRERGYGEEYLRNHLAMQNQIKKIVDQINFEINL